MHRVVGSRPDLLLASRQRRWLLACTIAEAVGMTAAAGAARGASVLVEHDVARARGLGFAIVVLGGLAEGVMLAALQSRVLGDILGPQGRMRWQLVTVLVAGVGWAAGSAPSTLVGPQPAGDPPPLTLILAGAAAIGAVMGTALGAAQAWALLDRVRHPWRWIGASAAAWTPAMAAIFFGASVVGASWSWPAVVLSGTATGVVAGAVLGWVSSLFLGTLDGLRLRHRMVLRLLDSPVRAVLGRGLIGIGVQGTRTGRWYRFPVMAAADDEGLVVFPGHPDRKSWWRNLRRGSSVEVLQDGRWEPARAELLESGDPARDPALATYARAWPRIRVPDGAPLVRLRFEHGWSAAR